MGCHGDQTCDRTLSQAQPAEEEAKVEVDVEGEVDALEEDG